MTHEELDPDFIPRVVVLGAGPIGIEAALYARFLGYEVAVLEQGKVANNVLRWGHVRMFSPFALNRSTLGIAALRAQSEDASLPEDDALLTGSEFAERYLIPLTQSDLLADSIHEGVTVKRVGRDGILKTDPQPGTDLDRSDFGFRVLVRLSNGSEDTIDADVVIDTTGVLDQPNSLGHGGIPAMGELSCQNEIHWHVPDVLGGDRDKFVDKRVLVVGSGYSAATNVVALAQLAKNSGTRITWVTRKESPIEGPIPVASDDRLGARSELALAANAVPADRYDQTSILSVGRAGTDAFSVTLGGKANGTFEFDAIIANVGYRPNTHLHEELQVELCSSTQSPVAVANWLLELGRVDAVDQQFPGPELFRTREPNFYILGSKSYGRNSNFLLSVGLQQIRDAFTIIAGRADLDLYQTMANVVA